MGTAGGYGGKLGVAIVAAAVLAAAPAAAVCTEFGCARAVDSDGDGTPDGAIAVLGVEHAALNAYAFRDGSFTYFELVAGDDHADAFHVVAVTAETGHEGHEGQTALHSVDARVTIVEVDGHSGESFVIAGAEASLHDNDDDGVPEHAHAALLP